MDTETRLLQACIAMAHALETVGYVAVDRPDIYTVRCGPLTRDQQRQIADALLDGRDAIAAAREEVA